MSRQDRACPGHYMYRTVLIPNRPSSPLADKTGPFDATRPHSVQRQRAKPWEKGGRLLCVSMSFASALGASHQDREASGSRWDFGDIGSSDRGSIPFSVCPRQVTFRACRVTAPCGEGIAITVWTERFSIQHSGSTVLTPDVSLHPPRRSLRSCIHPEQQSVYQAN